MGVEYRHYLIPRPNSFRPDAEQLTALITRLAADRWIAPPASEAFEKLVAIERTLYGKVEYSWARKRLRDSGATIRGFEPISDPITPNGVQQHLAGESRVEFPLLHADRIGVQYPLVCDSGIPDDAYYEIEIHLSEDYVHQCSECIDPVPTKCQCGEDLQYWPADDEDVFYAARIRTRCPKCSRAFDPARFSVSFRDGFTGNESAIKGGAAYRFALVIDCGKCIPHPKKPPLKANPRLIELCQTVLRIEFYQVGDFY